MKTTACVVVGIIFVFFGFVSVSIGEAPTPLDPKKHTEAGKYVTSLEAFEMWKSNPGEIRIIDCRTQEEYTFVGHATMAHNIPSRLWTYELDPELIYAPVK